MGKILDLIPSDIKIILGCFAFFSILIGLGVVYNKIDAAGYARCETAHEKAAHELETQARKEIVKVEKKHVGIRTQIINQKGPDLPVGPRVEYAIDSLPVPSDSGK